MPAFQWKAQITPTVRFLGGPERVVTDQPDPNFVRRPVGFLARLDPEPEP
jgi:hypothetical protein